MRKLAIITMVFNESDHLPRWIKYYSKQVDSLSDLYIIDHGSTDCSTGFLNKKINLTRVPRDKWKQDFERQRSEYIAGMANSLLLFYHSIIYVDCDEFIAVDPRVHASLTSFCEQIPPNRVISTIGYNVLHDINNEKDLRYGEKISNTRTKLYLTTSMFKASIVTTGAEVKWHDGFHFSNHIPIFLEVYLFHTRFADLRQGLKRLKLTRDLSDQPRLQMAQHQRVSDIQHREWLQGMLSCKKDVNDIGLKNPEIRDLIQSLEITKTNDFYQFPLNLSTNKLYGIPNYLKGTF